MRTALVQEKTTDWNFSDAETSNGLHSIHSYPAKFIPQIPRRLIQNFAPPGGTGILDPFCGSGTTLVEAQAAGFTSVGIDLNPIACLISRVKTSPLPEKFLEHSARLVNKAGSITARGIPKIPNLDHWFRPEVQDILSRLTHLIADIPEASLQDHLKVALSSIIVKVSNQDSDTRYAAVTKDVTGADVINAFRVACERLNKTKIAVATPDIPCRVLNKNTLTISSEEINVPIGLVVTSPPYPNAYEYWLYHKYRMWWLGYDPLEVKRHEIGARAHFFKKNHHTEENFRQQMSQTFKLLGPLVMRSGHVCIVIGRSRIHGREINNGDIILAVARQAGFRLAERIQRTIASNRKSFNLSFANIKQEEILVFQK